MVSIKNHSYCGCKILHQLLIWGLSIRLFIEFPPRWCRISSIHSVKMATTSTCSLQQKHRKAWQRILPDLRLPQLPEMTCGFPKRWGYLQAIHFSGIFQYKPSILGYPHGYGKPHMWTWVFDKTRDVKNGFLSGGTFQKEQTTT